MTRKKTAAIASPEPPPESHVTPEVVLYDVLEPFMVELRKELLEQAQAAMGPLIAGRKFVAVQDKGFVDLHMETAVSTHGHRDIRFDLELELDYRRLRKDTWMQEPFNGQPISTSHHKSDHGNKIGEIVVRLFKSRTGLNVSASNCTAQEGVVLAARFTQMAQIGTQLEALILEALHDRHTAIGKAMLTKLREVRNDQIERGVIKVEEPAQEASA